ncbi:MAG: GmrSD restriction endonuclease domain-containing protein [Bacteroidales bacterium]
METFDSTKTSLHEILKDIHKGKIQLPDFQREWVWDDNRIKGILASVAKSFPIGAVMLLETGNETIRFKPKPVKGVPIPEVNGKEPELLILDGQQRLTSLYQAIITNRVVTTRNPKGYEIKRWYYIDMIKALDPGSDLEEAIFSINEKKILTEDIGRKVVLDLTTRENEYKNMMYPVCMVDEYDQWYPSFFEYWNFDKEKIQFWNEFHKKIIQGFNGYMLPVIVMKKSNPKEAVCQVFEKVNTGGVSLTVFELLTASFAAEKEEFNLKDDWENIKAKFRDHKVLGKTGNIDVIQAITLFSTYQQRKKIEASGTSENLPAVSAKRREMLNLTLTDYEKYKDRIVDGFIKASKMLVENHIYNSRDVPYTTQLVPMSAIIAELGKEIDNIGNKQKLMRWFWCGVFGELYGSATETRYALDLVQVVDWIVRNGPEPKTIYDANFSPSRLHTLRTRNSAAYKGVYAVLMDENTRDWLSATKIDFSTYFSEAIDIHHIFPVAWCNKNGIPSDDYHCIINKTPLSGRTNRIVGGDAPSKYLDRLKKHAGVSDGEFNAILESHVVNPELMYRDDFKGFFHDRKERILKKIENAMGKPVVRDATIQEEGVYHGDEFENENDGEL